MSASTDIAQVLGSQIDDAEAEFRRLKQRETWRRRILPCIGILIGIGVWAALVYVFKVPPFIAPSPFTVLETLISKFDVLMNNLWPTMIEAVGGFIIGNVFAITLATIFVHRKTVSETFFPLVVLINSIPVVAKAPILVLLLGNGFAPKIAIAAVISFFPTLVNMVRGLESVNPQAMELMRVLSASKREVFLKLRLYNSLPYLFSALRISASSSVVGAIVGEWIGSNYGIGALIIQATYAFDSALLYATVFVGSVFSVLFFMAIGLAERLVVRWQPASVG
ncbi:NitT/TauT family transport system permease protein [Rhizobiales bacterium GAS191]|nr:NitT/TauT family transport system permease protein [Rhizobiales bacterium GAS113]SEC09621.1 NitT/TauT family transport system permease protein [Rhizobiales bacterium GAS191]SED10485.1 NitT/TauT family transport system permease protein [Rhizobiales bacterium GAS188]